MTTRRPRQPTLADIAARAGTTVPTVSKVLNGRSDVSVATRNRIMELVAETGYLRRSGSVPAQPSSDRRLIDLVLTGVAGSWANQVLIGVETAAAEAGFDLVVTVARDRTRARAGSVTEDWTTRLLARSSQGAVLALVDAGAEQLATLAAARIPVVLLDPVEQPPESSASVGATNWAGGRAACEHLLGLGHRRLAVLSGHPSQLFSRARVDGFSSAARLHEAVFGAQVAIEIEYAEVGQDALAAAGRLLDRTDRPSAIFACSDDLALRVLQSAAERGLRVPDQLSLVGFDDLPEARWAGLTTIRQPIADMGAAALRMLLRLRTELRPLPREELATNLVIRNTTAPPSAA
jgi:LacI family transcriptional regulator